MFKARLVLMVLLAAVVMTPVQATLVDPMTQGSILDQSRDPLIGPGRWHDERDTEWPQTTTTSVLKDSAFSHDGDGSMMIDYSYWLGVEPAPEGDPYDRVARGYFQAGNGTYDPGLGDLTGQALSFWWYKGDALSPEHVRELQIYSPDGMARFAVANGGEGNPVMHTDGTTSYTGMQTGWQYVQTAVVNPTDWVYEGSFDITAVDTIDFWCSAWHQDWTNLPDPPGDWYPIEEQMMPTGQPIYIDDLRVVPEPTTMSLLGLGMLALLKRRKA